jgi:hypothetical protein
MSSVVVCRQPFHYAPERPTTGKVRVARDPPTTPKKKHIGG